MLCGVVERQHCLVLCRRQVVGKAVLQSAGTIDDGVMTFNDCAQSSARSIFDRSAAIHLISGNFRRARDEVASEAGHTMPIRKQAGCCRRTDKACRTGNQDVHGIELNRKVASARGLGETQARA